MSSRLLLSPTPRHFSCVFCLCFFLPLQERGSALSVFDVLILCHSQSLALCVFVIIIPPRRCSTPPCFACAAHSSHAHVPRSVSLRCWFFPDTRARYSPRAGARWKKKNRKKSESCCCCCCCLFSIFCSFTTLRGDALVQRKQKRERQSEEEANRNVGKWNYERKGKCLCKKISVKMEQSIQSKRKQQRRTEKVKMNDKLGRGIIDRGFIKSLI